MSATTIDPRTRLDLEEAIREIHVIAGLEGIETTGPTRSITIGVTSPDNQDGKTTIAIALAASLSHDFGTQVTLVDADFHTHSLERQYGLEGRSGFAEVLDGHKSLGTVLHASNKGGMTVIPAGIVSSDPTRLARSDRLGPAIDQMKQTCSHVVLDLPATLRSMSAAALAQKCDAVIIVVRNGKTTTQQLERTVHLLKDSRVVGVVVNRQQSSIPSWVERVLGMKA